jgi:hypothetical protein
VPAGLHFYYFCVAASRLRQAASVGLLFSRSLVGLVLAGRPLRSISDRSLSISVNIRFVLLHSECIIKLTAATLLYCRHLTKPTEVQTQLYCACMDADQRGVKNYMKRHYAYFRRLPTVRPSVRVYQRGSHWTDLREILYIIFLYILYCQNP